MAQETYSNGRSLDSTLASFDEARDALLITDQHMPEMQGAELIRTLQRLCPSLPMIAMTGAEVEGELLAAGAREILKKPLDIRQIEEAVERGLKGKTIED
ncbi:MAG: response regulator [Nitrospinae bacterium]|nr:response regulator [Nitrospinota bacterium]